MSVFYLTTERNRLEGVPTGSRTSLGLTFHSSLRAATFDFVTLHFSHTFPVCADVCDMRCVSAGEGYECTVTVDDEDSKVIIFDNWKQVSL